MEADYLGIDPGLSGGFAVISGDKISYKMAMPTISFTTKDGKTKTEIDRDAVLSFLFMLPQHTNVAIEKQEAFRGQDITSSCTICRNYGILQMALTVARMYISEVSAKDWHDFFGIVSAKEGKGTTKEQAFHIAQKLYPNADFRKSERSHIVHDGMVDATCLAVYCQSLLAPFHEPPLEVKPLECKLEGKEAGIKLQRRMFCMIAIKRRCKFFDQCQIASVWSITCTENGGGDYCGMHRTLSQLQKKKQKEEKRTL